MQLWQRRLMLMVLLVAGPAGMAGSTGCAGGSPGSAHMPAGTYNIQIEVTAGTVQMVPLAVVVQ